MHLQTIQIYHLIVHLVKYINILKKVFDIFSFVGPNFEKWCTVLALIFTNVVSDSC